MQALVYNRPGQTPLNRRINPPFRNSGEDTLAKSRRLVSARNGQESQRDGDPGALTADPADTADTADTADRVLVSCITACGHCDACCAGMYPQCTNRTQMSGRRSHTTQAKAARISAADWVPNLNPNPARSVAGAEALVMLSDLLPMGFERGVLNGKIHAGSSVAIVGSGPAGLAALLTAQVHRPAAIIMIDLDDNRLEVAKHFGATAIVNRTDGTAAQKVMQLTSGRGVDTAVDASGLAETAKLCVKIVAHGGVVANVRASGCREVDLQLEQLWSLLDRLLVDHSISSNATARFSD